MKEKILGLIKLILAILIIVFANQYYTSFLALIGINYDELSSFIQECLTLGLYLLMGYAIFIIYKDKIKGDLSRFKRKWFNNLLMSIVYFAIFTIGIFIFNYLVEILADTFNTQYFGLTIHEILKQKFNINSLFLIIKMIIVMPFITCVTFVVGSEELFNRKNMNIFFSGAIAAFTAVLTISGEFLFIFFNMLPYFAIYFGLAYIYRRNNSNIWFSIIAFVLYSLLAGALIARIG